jgi:nicotinamide riboside kinase
MLRVAFVGSHSTGKTTLLEYCKQRLAGRLNVIEDVARRVIKRGFPMGDQAGMDSFSNFIRDQFRAEHEAGRSSCEILISNRTVLDSAAYAHVNRALAKQCLPDYFVEMLEEVAWREADYYQLFVNFKVSFALVNDGVRPVDERYRQQVGDRISGLLTRFAIRHIEVSGSTEARYSQLMDAITQEEFRVR